MPDVLPPAALLITIESRPPSSLSSTRAASARTEANLLRSSGMNVAEPAPGTFRAIAFISFAAAMPAATFQPSSARITSAPCMQSARAAALPRPDAPPVISAAAPERLR